MTLSRVCLLISVVILLVVNAQAAKFFVFSYFPTAHGTIASPYGQIYVSNPGTRAAYVHVRTPLLTSTDSGYFSADSYAPPLGTVNFTIPAATLLSVNGVQSNGVVVCATQDVTVQIDSNGGSLSDISSIPPPTALGSDYVITTYFYVQPGYFVYPGPIGLAVTAVHDGTTVQVALKGQYPLFLQYNGFNYTNGQIITEVLDKYQALLITVPVNNAPWELTGTRVISSNPVFVAAGVGRSLAEGSSLDHMSDVVFPTNQLATLYFFISTPTRLNGDDLRITAGPSNTNYTVIDNNGFLLANGSLAALSMTQIRTASNHYYMVQATAPVQVTLFALSTAADNVSWSDNSMMTIRPMALGASMYVFTTMVAALTTYNHYLGLIVPTSDIQSILLNGQPMNMNWTQFYNSAYSGAITRLPDLIGAFYKVVNKAGNPFLAYLYELGLTEAGAMSIYQLSMTPDDVNQGAFTKTITDIILSSASLGCQPVVSRQQCVFQCLQLYASCAGIQYNPASSTACCLLADQDILTASRTARGGLEIWQWTNDVTMCTL